MQDARKEYEGSPDNNIIVPSIGDKLISGETEMKDFIQHNESFQSFQSLIMTMGNWSYSPS
jgi:hypothetical protein